MVLVDVECLSSELTAADLNKRKRSAKGAKEWSRWSIDRDHLCRISCRAPAIDFEGPQAPPRIQGCSIHLEEKRFGVLTVPRKKKKLRLNRIKKINKKQLYFMRQITCPSQGICAVVASQIPKGDIQALELREFLRQQHLRTRATVRLFNTPFFLSSADPRRRRSSSIPRS
jgi:hypothetical protein